MAEYMEDRDKRCQQDVGPTTDAFQDQTYPHAVYHHLDCRDLMCVGPHSRTQIFIADGRHQPQFRTTGRRRQPGVQPGPRIRGQPQE